MNGKFLFLAKRIKYSTAVISKTKVRCAAISFILKQYCTCSLIAVVKVVQFFLIHKKSEGGSSNSNFLTIEKQKREEVQKQQRNTKKL